MAIVERWKSVEVRLFEFFWQFLSLFCKIHWLFPGLEHVSIFSWPGDSVFVSFTPVKATLQLPWTWNAVKRIAYLGGCVFAVFMKLVHLMIHLFQLQLNILTLLLQISLLCHLLADRLFIQYKTTVIDVFEGRLGEFSLIDNELIA